MCIYDICNGIYIAVYARGIRVYLYLWDMETFSRNARSFRQLSRTSAAIKSDVRRSLQVALNSGYAYVYDYNMDSGTLYPR